MSDQVINAHQALIRLAKKHGNDWARIYDSVKSAEQDVNDIEDPSPAELMGWEPIAILGDDAYPDAVRQNVQQPPFVLFSKGDASNLSPDALLIISPRRYVHYPAIGDMLRLIVKEGIPGVIVWSDPDKDAAGNGYALEALRAYQGSGVPFTVLISGACVDPDGLSDIVAASGGLALTERYPGAPARPDVKFCRIGAGLAKAALVLGGTETGIAPIALHFALNAGLDVGALAWPAMSPDGRLCQKIVHDGGAYVYDIDDVKELLGRNAE